MNKILLTTSVMVMTPMMTLAADTPREANETLGALLDICLQQASKS